MSTDLNDRIQQLAPDQQALEDRWPVAERAELARRIVAGETGSRRHAPRRLVVGLAGTAAAAVLGAVAVPALLPHHSPVSASPAAAEVLHRLARVAADTPADTVRPGQFVHTVEDSRQVGIPGNPEDGPVHLDMRIDTWSAYDGRSWIRHTEGGETTMTFTERDRSVSAAHFASLPTDPDALEDYFRRTVHGSSSRDEAVFVAVGSVLAAPEAPAGLRSAAATVLARTPHVGLGATTTDERGRRVNELDFVDESIRPGMVQALFVDPTTAQVVGMRTTQPGSTYGSTTVTSSVVDEVPPGIVRTAEPASMHF